MLPNIPVAVASGGAAPGVDFGGVRTYCMFLCHPRSGHSLFGSMLDAHPEMVVAHEFHALRALHQGSDRTQLFAGLWQRSQSFHRAGRKWNGYVYRVPNQWQGRCRSLRVIGDKQGFSSLQLLQRCPRLLPALQATVGVPVKIFQLVRNPFDNLRNLACIYHRGNLDAAITRYFSTLEAIQHFHRLLRPEDWMLIHHEDVVAHPHATLQAACRFLGVEATDDYLHDCASIVFKSPRRRRHEIAWTDRQRRRVEEQLRQHELLARYTFAD